jgi:hypothetical protein
MSIRGIAVRVAFVCFIAQCLTAPAMAQLSTGSISGYVQDGSGAVIPGVTVSLINPGVVGGNQQTVTNERGFYEFTRLVPATYGVRAELPGFKPSVLQNLDVRADFTVRGDLTLSVGAVSDEVTITGEAPLLDTTSALNQSVLDRFTLDNIPTGHDLWSIGRTVTGVTMGGTYDVGGSNSFQQSTPAVHGTAQTDNKYAIDGLDVAWADGAGLVMVYFDPNMFEEVNYQTANIGAESKQGGVVMNMVTKTGTNQFHGSYMFTGTNPGLQADNLSPTLVSQLSKQIPASVLAANPNIRPGQQIDGLFDTALSLSGPVMRDKFWFTSTYKISSLNQKVLGNYNPNGTQGIDDNRIYNFNFKLSYQLSHSSQIGYTFSRNQKYRYHRRFNTYQEDATTVFQDQWADIHQVKWTDTINSHLIADAGVSLQVGPTPYVPNALATQAAAQGQFARYNTSNTSYYTIASNYQIEPQYRASTNFNMSYLAGRHEFKVGYQFSRVLFRNNNFSIEDLVNGPLPGPFLAQYSGAVTATSFGTPTSVVIYNYPSATYDYEQEYGIFAQDRWNVSKKLTLNIGVRFDHVAGWVPQVCQPTTAWLNGQCFAAINSPAIPNLLNTAPRLSFVYDLAGDGRTAIKGSASIYDTGIDATYPDRVNPYKAVMTTISCWNNVAGDGVPHPNEIGFDFAAKAIMTAAAWKARYPNLPAVSSCGTPFAFGNTNIYNPNLKAPFSAEFSVGMQRQMPGGFVVTGTYFHRDYWRPIASINTALNYSYYTPISVTFPENNQTMTIYNISAAGQALSSCSGVGACNLWSNHSDQGNRFNGFDLSVVKRLTNHWSLTSGLEIGSNQQRIASHPDNPNAMLFEGGPTSINVPFSFKASGIYQAPFGAQVAANFQTFAGTPEQSTYTIPRTPVVGGTSSFAVPSLTPSTLTVPINIRGATSLPQVTMLDLSLSRQFRFYDGRIKVAPKIEFFNLGNAATTTKRSVQLTGLGQNAYLNPSTVLNPRMIRLGIQTNF